MTSKIGNLQDLHVIITGANGWLGRPLVNLLLKNGVHVIALNSRKELKSLIENKKPSPMPVNDNSPVALIHLAGKAHAGDCQKDPRAAFEANVVLTFQVLEFCRKHSIKKFIFPSTGVVYGNTKEHPAREDSPIYPYDIYSATKLAAENLVQGYAENYHLAAVVIRLSNVYGSEGNPDTVSQTILRQIKTSRDPILLRSGLPKRDFIFIDDVIQAFYQLLLADVGHGFRLFNVSTGVGTSVSFFAQTACKIAGIVPVKIQELESTGAQDSSLILDNLLLRQSTGWNPRFSLSEGLTRILKEVV